MLFIIIAVVFLLISANAAYVKDWQGCIVTAILSVLYVFFYFQFGI